MNYLYFILVTGLLFLLVSGANVYNFFPNLPAGKFKINFVAIIKCNEPQDSTLEFNYFLSKTSRNTTEMRGNSTIRRQLDDSFTIHINMAVKDSIGGWKHNAFIFKFPNACTILQKNSMSEFLVYKERMGYNTSHICPIPAGLYISKGYDLSRMQLITNFPKIFFYGTYKIRFYFTDKNNIETGCQIYVVDILRPWEFV